MAFQQPKIVATFPLVAQLQDKCFEISMGVAIHDSDPLTLLEGMFCYIKNLCFSTCFYVHCRFTILLMIFVNYGAGEYNWLKHAPWDGLHLADVVFPFFIFIMGASIAVGFKNLSQRSTFSTSSTFRRVVGRSIKLFLLGLITNSIGSGISSNSSVWMILIFVLYFSYYLFFLK